MELGKRVTGVWKMDVLPFKVTADEFNRASKRLKDPTTGEFPVAVRDEDVIGQALRDAIPTPNGTHVCVVSYALNYSNDNRIFYATGFVAIIKEKD